MTRISGHYRLSGELPFVDLHVDRDNKLFLDPSAIRNSIGEQTRGPVVRTGCWSSSSRTSSAVAQAPTSPTSWTGWLCCGSCTSQ